MTVYTLRPDTRAHGEPGHPERPDRTAAIAARLASDPALKVAGDAGQLVRIAGAEAARDAIERVHSSAYLDALDALAASGGGAWDADTYVTPDSPRVARETCGDLLAVVDAVLGGTATNGFAIGRPPGHHARPDAAMGFCLVSHAAVAARHAQAGWGAERVLIVDIDVHHGNGTEEAFHDDSTVTTLSLHAGGLYPGTGQIEDIGTGRGRGSAVNLPLPAGTDDAGAASALQQILSPLAARIRPSLVLLSAGYDAHRLDPLGTLSLSVAGLTDLVRIVRRVADAYAGGRLVATLEGGYHAEVLAYGVASTLRVLLEADAPAFDPFGPTRMSGPDVQPVVEAVQRMHELPVPDGA